MIETELTEVLHALGDPIRLAIVRELADQQPHACGTFGHLGVSHSTLSESILVASPAGTAEQSAQHQLHHGLKCSS